MSKTWPSFHKWGPFSLSSISNRIIDLINLTNKKSDSNKTVFIVIGNGYDGAGCDGEYFNYASYLVKPLAPR